MVDTHTHIYIHLYICIDGFLNKGENENEGEAGIDKFRVIVPRP
jgi:hypothetical protein